MKFLVNAHLPRRIVKRLVELGHDATHTMDLPRGNRTSDAFITSLCLREQRVLITKDGDFVDSFLLKREPYKLLLISTGNISNSELETLLFSQLDGIVRAFEEYSYLELSRTNLIYHE